MIQPLTVKTIESFCTN